MIGHELIFCPSLSFLERLYIYLFGAPISGLRVRVRRLMPKLEQLIQRLTADKSRSETILSVIDVGCGTGILSLEIAKRFPQVHVTGMDNCAELIEKGTAIVRKAGIQNCAFQVADTLTLNAKDTFDLAICIDILEHIEDDTKAISMIRQCLKPGGYALFHVPGLYRRWMFFGRKQNFDVKGHVRPGYTLEDIAAKITREGFAIKEAHYTYGWLETVTNNMSYLITGADHRNKHFYALAFPLLNALAFLGQWSRPTWGAGVVVVAEKTTEK